MPDENGNPTVEELQAENEALRAQLATSGGTGAMGGPGTPDYFYAVGGVGDIVTDPATGEPVLNAVSGAPVVQEHPSVEAEAALAAAQAKLAKGQEMAALQIANGEQAVADAQAEVDNADARYDEIVADLVAQSQTEG